jgi:predicted nuclease of predicted toxin-antitoxin system
VKIVIDMNLGTAWIPPLRAAGHDAIHWSSVGHISATDTSIMAWAKARGHVVFTADLDFGGHLVRSGEDGPSVVQLRTADTLAVTNGRRVLEIFQSREAALLGGALITIEHDRVRIRLLSDTQPS